MKAISNLDDFLILILRVATFLCFAGWAWVHYYWEGPYAVLVWNDTVYGWAQSLGYNWEDVVGTGANDGLFQKALSQLYIAYAACAILAFTVKPGKTFQITALSIGFVLMCTLMYAKYLGSKGQLPMFVEHGGQMLMPMILISALCLGIRHKITLIVSLVAFVTTFAGHGCYALGLWPTPSNFYAMTTVILGMEFETTKLFLRTAGVLDFVVCLGVFIPSIRKYCAIYAAIWGLVTALARPVAGMSTDLLYWGADQYLHEAVLRAPHYFIPFFLVLLWHYQNQPKTTSNP